MRAAGDSREPVGTGGPVGFQGRRGQAGERRELDWASWGAQGGGQQKAGLEGSREGKGAREGGGEGGGAGGQQDNSSAAFPSLLPGNRGEPNPGFRNLPASVALGFLRFL